MGQGELADESALKAIGDALSIGIITALHYPTNTHDSAVNKQFVAAYNTEFKAVNLRLLSRSAATTACTLSTRH